MRALALYGLLLASLLGWVWYEHGSHAAAWGLGFMSVKISAFVIGIAIVAAIGGAIALLAQLGKRP